MDAGRCRPALRAAHHAGPGAGAHARAGHPGGRAGLPPGRSPGTAPQGGGADRRRLHQPTADGAARRRGLGDRHPRAPAGRGGAQPAQAAQPADPGDGRGRPPDGPGLCRGTGTGAGPAARQGTAPDPAAVGHLRPCRARPGGATAAPRPRQRGSGKHPPAGCHHRPARPVCGRRPTHQCAARADRPAPRPAHAGVRGQPLQRRACGQQAVCQEDLCHRPAWRAEPGRAPARAAGVQGQPVAGAGDHRPGGAWHPH